MTPDPMKRYRLSEPQALDRLLRDVFGEKLPTRPVDLTRPMPVDREDGQRPCVRPWIPGETWTWSGETGSDGFEGWETRMRIHVTAGGVLVTTVTD